MPENRPHQTELLVEELSRGSERAFHGLYTQYGKKVYLLGIKLGYGHEDAEGLVQEVFLKIWKNKTQLKPEFCFEAYLVKVAKSMVYRKVSRMKLEKDYIQHLGSSKDSKDNGTEDYVIFQDLLCHSLSELDSLSPKQKQVFMMKNFEHLSVDEIAERLNLSKRTVENQIFRASKQLKKKISGLGNAMTVICTFISLG